MSDLNNILMGLKLADLESSKLYFQEDLDPLIYANSYSLSCYPEDALYHDVQLILDLIVSRQRMIGEKDELLDIGSASSIPYSLALSRLVKSVYISDISESHLNIVSKWAKGEKGSRSWNTYTRYILNNEKTLYNIPNVITDEEIQLRELQYKRKLQALIKGDLCRNDPLGQKRQFDIVSCFYATEPAATSLASKSKIFGEKEFTTVWCQIISNLVSLIKPQGHLFISCLINTDYYAIYDEFGRASKIKINSISSSLLEFALQSADLKIISLDYVNPVGLSEEGINKIALVHAQKRY